MELQLNFEDVASALSLDYECVFFVDVETSNYAMFDFRGNHSKLDLRDSHDFWADTAVNTEAVVYPEDKASFASFVNRDSLVKAIQTERVNNFKYRLMVDGKPTWYQMKVALTHSHGRKFLVIGVNNIDKLEREQIELKDKASKSETYSQIAVALASRFDALYMVDLRTDHFIQYKSERVFSELGIAREGDDFFNLLISDARKAVYKEDFTLVTESLKKETLLKELDDYGAFTLTYRLNSQKGAVYVKMIAAYTDKEHLAISITNVNSQVRREQKLRAKILQNEVYGQIVMALAERYDALYMVDLETDHFAQYKAERMYSHLNVAVEGEDFFNQLQKDALQVIYAEDIPLVQTSLVRDVLLKELDDNGLFSLTYRLNSPTGPVYVNLVAMYSGEKHIVISVTNIDTQVRREQKIREEAAIAYQKAHRDDLTGIRNKNAYGEFERKLNEQILSGEIKEFAIAICDVNELKTVNDTQGHKAGDEYIRSASKLVCDTFKHSPVFRIGGDEFVAILRGCDFESRENLEKKFKDTVKYNTEEKKVVVACGIADFDKLNDKNVSAVFERADALMYKDKMSLKS